MNWSALPDLVAVALLAIAFASVARRSPTPVSGIWLTGWMMIVLHFGSFLFLKLPGSGGMAAEVLGLCALIWAGLLFMWSAVPYRAEPSSRWMFGLLATVNTLYLSLNAINPAGDWATVPAAALLGIAPLAVALSVIRKFNPRLRWILVSLYLTLSLFILLEQHHSPNGMGLAGDALIFTVYFGCCVHFWYSYRRGTAGAFVTIAGFAGWAAVFVVSPVMDLYWPSVPIENEVWNLPKYVVAVGMILLLLEDQIEHTKYLALHDHLTGLANRRLFQEQLESALNRARRAGTQMALLVVDLDQFKQVNDTLGHHVGDMVLKRVAELFMARVRHTDTVARTGGDEFSIILAEPTSRERATAVVRSLLQIIAEPIQLGDGHSAKIGASVGMAVFPDDAKDLQTLCIEADLRMYDSKYDATEDHGHTIDSRETGSQEQARGAGTLRRATDR